MHTTKAAHRMATPATSNAAMSAPQPAVLFEKAAGKKRRVDEPEERNEAADSITTNDSAVLPDYGSNKKAKVFDENPILQRGQVERPQKINQVQLLRKTHREDLKQRGKKGMRERILYAASKRKVLLTPHRRLAQKKIQDVDMGQDPAIEGTDVELERTQQPHAGPVSLRTLVANKDARVTQPLGGPFLDDATDQEAAAEDSGDRAPTNATAGATPTSATADPTSTNAQPDVGPTAQAPTSTVQFFTRTLPGIYTPWHLTFAQPRARYDQEKPCPINWASIPGLEQPDRDAYELRAPWNPKPNSWSAAVVAYGHLRGANATIKSPEGIRKRFKRANLAIFENTRVYFHMSSLGLEVHGIPIDSKLPRLEKEANAAAVAAIAQPPKARPDATDVSEEDPIVAITPDADSAEANSKPKEKKTWVRRVLPCHINEAALPLTIHKLLDRYCDARHFRDIAKGDMILDKIYRGLEREKALNVKYGANGAVCDENIHDVVRLLDLKPNDIAGLWARTSPSDPIRKLLVDLFLHQVDDLEQARQQRHEALHSSVHAQELYTAFARDHRQAAIESFVEGLSPDAFCEMYHDHHNLHGDNRCYRHQNRSLKEPLLFFWKDAAINGVWGYTVEIKTEFPIDLQALIKEKPQWDWERLKSVSYHIQIPPRGPQKRVRMPEYYRREERDLKGHYPGHPEYNASEGGSLSARHWYSMAMFGEPDH